MVHPTNEHELLKRREAAALAAIRRLPDSWPLVPVPPQAKPAPLPTPPAPEPVKVARIDPPAPPKVVRQRRPRFTWGSPEVYWEDEEENLETVSTNRKSKPQTTRAPQDDNPWSGWDL
jgi:hypothetical protein